MRIAKIFSVFVVQKKEKFLIKLESIQKKIEIDMSNLWKICTKNIIPETIIMVKGGVKYELSSGKRYYIITIKELNCKKFTCL